MLGNTSGHWLGAGSGIRGLGFNYNIAQDCGAAELYIDRGETEENKRIFDQLNSQKSAIEKNFGAPLSWERLDDKQACRVKHIVERGGYRSPEQQWPEIQAEMVDTMTRLDAALKGPLESLDL